MHAYTHREQRVRKVLLALYNTSDSSLNITDYTSISLPCRLGQGGKEVQHDKAKAFLYKIIRQKKVVCGFLFYFHRLVPDFGKIC